MLELVVGLFQGIINLLKSVLPVSPFRDLTISQDVGNALGWLNWVFPISDCLAIMTAWLAALLLFTIARFVIGKIKLVTSLSK